MKTSDACDPLTLLLSISRDRAGELFHAAARRYVDCQRAAALPALRNAEDEGAALSALSLADMWTRPPPGYEPRNCYGFDVASLNEDDVFVIIYTIIILNADLRAPSIKTKMTKAQYVSLNATVESLRHVPAHFFEGLYDEVAVRGLPINDVVPVAPVTTSAHVDVDQKLRMVLRPLVRSAAAVVRDGADTALLWLRRFVATAAAASGTPPIPLYRADTEVLV